MDKLKQAIELTLSGLVLIFIFYSPTSVINKYTELSTDIFTKIFGNSPDIVMKIIYLGLPFIALNIIGRFLWFKIIMLISLKHHKKFEGLWFSDSKNILDIFLIYNNSIIPSSFKLIKMVKCERYDIKTQKIIFHGFTTLDDKAFSRNDKERECSIPINISIFNHKNLNEKIFVEINIHLHCNKFDCVSVCHNIKNEKIYSRIKLEKYTKSDELLRVVHEKDKFDEKYARIVEELLTERKINLKDDNDKEINIALKGMET